MFTHPNQPGKKKKGLIQIGDLIKSRTTSDEERLILS